MRRILVALISISLLGLLVYKFSFQDTRPTVSYNYEVRPILSDKCYACHGPDENKRKADLRLDQPAGLFGSSGDHPEKFIVHPGSADLSELFHRISHPDTSELMPPPETNLALTPEEVAIIENWIDQGAEYQKHWAFIPPEKVPVERASDWERNEIDYFTYKKMRTKGLKPNDEADKERLLKRLSFDLTGLPPTIEMMDRFLEDESNDAYDRAIDELLASRHYGEKMAIPWLDVARYADSHGYQDDGLRTMWPWRDWVIHAFNSNYSYKKFVIMQLAGDLMPEATKEDLLATGFNRNHKITQEGGVIDEEYRIEYVTDRTNTFGKAFLGMTMECAKCHDHKFDPISMEEYYGTFAFFNYVPEKGLFGDISVASLADPPAMEISDEDITEMLQFINKKDTGAVSVMIMKDSLGLRETHILDRGNYDGKGEVVTHQTPDDILPFDTTLYEPNRAGLTQWLFDDNNPLTSRVFVNRMWEQFFGKGIVATSGDFGLQGSIPTHPELLDWLAVDFVENGWDIKRLVKQMVSSATYRQSTVITPSKQKKDPENVYLSRMPRRRLQAEIIRDLLLASSGLLVPEIGGPSVKPYQPEGLWDAATSGRGILKRYIQDHNEDLYRRGMYTFIKRTVPPPSMLIFDGSNRDQCEVQRTPTNTPLQALVLLNDPTVLEASRVLSETLHKSGKNETELISQAFRKIVCRQITKKELEILSAYYEEELEVFANDPDKAIEFLETGEYAHESATNEASVAALMQVILTMYNLDEATTLT